MYMFWHFLFALALGLFAYRLVHANPAGQYVAIVVSAGVLVDIDHLLAWRPEFLLELLPTYFPEGLTFTLRTSVYPMILHLWLWPLFIVAASLLLRSRKVHAYLVAAAMGWSLHLALDCVLVIV